MQEFQAIYIIQCIHIASMLNKGIIVCKAVELY